jgi:hypothetical protein
VFCAQPARYITVCFETWATQKPHSWLALDVVVQDRCLVWWPATESGEQVASACMQGSLGQRASPAANALDCSRTVGHSMNHAALVRPHRQSSPGRRSGAATAPPSWRRCTLLLGRTSIVPRRCCALPASLGPAYACMHDSLASTRARAIARQHRNTSKSLHASVTGRGDWQAEYRT